MSITWAIIVGTIVLLVIYGIVSSNIQERQQRAARQKTVPYIEETVCIGQRYVVYLSDGRAYRDVEILGTNDPKTGQYAVGGWEGMLVLKQASGKRLFIRQPSIRCVEEL